MCLYFVYENPFFLLITVQVVNIYINFALLNIDAKNVCG